MRALLGFLLFLSLALPGSPGDRMGIVWKGQAGSPPANACNAELKFRDPGFLLLVDGAVDRSFETGDVEDAFAGGARAIIFGAPVTGDASALNKKTKAGTPILVYDRAPDSRVGVFVSFDRWKANELLRSAAMTEEDPPDRDSF